MKRYYLPANKYLMCWEGYQKNALRLTELDKNRAGIFFNAMKILSTEEADFLASKYMTGNLMRGPGSKEYELRARKLSDQDHATKLGISLKLCSEKRREIERKLQEELNRLVDLVAEKEADKATEYFLVLGNLYYISQCGSNVVTTLDKKKAAVFLQDSIEGERIRRQFGMEKEIANFSATPKEKAVRHF